MTAVVVGSGFGGMAAALRLSHSLSIVETSVGAVPVVAGP